MREIKLRVWHNPWDEGFVMDYDYKLHNQPGIELNFMLKSHKDHILMQYTGLKDKNGVEIYEGDILGLVHKKNGLVNKQTVIWNSEAAAFDWDTTNSDSWPDGFTGFIDEYEVIGNIYENPELVK